MSLRSLSLCLLLLRFHPIFRSLTLAASAAAGTLKLYDDYDCDYPSTLNPTVNLTLSTCLVTTGGGGLIIADLPLCSQGDATLIYYQDPACGTQTSNAISSIIAANCFQLAEGTDLYNAKSVMFSCQAPANNPQPSSTTTAVVSALAAVATGSTGYSATGSSTSAAEATPTSPNNQKTSTDSSGGSTSTGADTGSSSHSSSGLDTGDIIALAVGLGIGTIAIAVAIAAWLLPNFRFTLQRWFSGGVDLIIGPHHQPYQHNQPNQHTQHNQPYQQHYNNPQQMPMQQQPFHRYQ